MITSLGHYVASTLLRLLLEHAVGARELAEKAWDFGRHAEKNLLRDSNPAVAITGVATQYSGRLGRVGKYYYQVTGRLRLETGSDTWWMVGKRAE